MQQKRPSIFWRCHEIQRGCDRQYEIGFVRGCTGILYVKIHNFNGNLTIRLRYTPFLDKPNKFHIVMGMAQWFLTPKRMFQVR